MLYDFSFLWPWLLLVLLIGGAVGMNVEPPDWSASIADSRIKQALIVLLIAALLAWVHLFSGRFAFWWESAVLFAAAYILGGVIGSRFPRRSAAAG